MVRLKLVDIVITGEAESDKDFQRLIRRSGLTVGEPLNHGQYDSLKSGLRNLALQKAILMASTSSANLKSRQSSMKRLCVCIMPVAFAITLVPARLR